MEIKRPEQITQHGLIKPNPKTQIKQLDTQAYKPLVDLYVLDFWKIKL